MFIEGNWIVSYDEHKKHMVKKSKIPFRVSIHDPMSVADLHGKGATVKPGYATTFLITPLQIVTSRNAKNLPFKKRECLFKQDSHKLDLFEGYTQANCFFECQLKTAYAKCQCFPWDYPRLNDTWELCDWMGRDCFRTMVKKTDLNEQCNCPLDCATTRYTYSYSSTIIDAEEICTNDEYKEFITSIHTGYPPKFIKRFEQITLGKDIGEDIDCINRTKSMAIVNFEIADQIITRIKKTQRMTFADFLSNIGNQLFTFQLSISKLFSFPFLQEVHWDYSLASVYLAFMR